MAGTWYADSSALVKLLVEEAESGVLRDAIRDQPITTSELALVEVPRAVARLGLPQAAASLLAMLDIVPLSADVIAMAASLPPVDLRSLDAIHVASALNLGTRCGGLITYDRRMVAAALAAGLTVQSPGRVEAP